MRINNMQITIDLHLVVNKTRTALSGHFQARFVNDIPQIAHEWIRKVRRETGYSATIEKVVYNGDNDITTQVKEIDEKPIPDLPFLW
jgi:hypothetical protein